jgi:phospholipid transport system substrate-binding protein
MDRLFLPTNTASSWNPVMKGIAVIFSVSLVALHAVCSVGAQEKAESPTETVQGTVTQILQILADPRLKGEAQQASRRRLLEETISKRFDYREMSKRTLASQWSRLSEQERTEFVNLFKQFLSDRYAGRIGDYSGEKVVYLGERLEGQYAEVRTKLIASKAEYPMDYRLINKEGKWYAYDIIADGVSLVKNYRSQFEKILRTGSYEELVARLRDRSVPDERKGNPS